jgi:Flp pilus assembly CpaE family ATPase
MMGDKKIRILLIEDNPGDGRLIQEFLADAQGVQFDLVRADRLSAGLTRLERGGIDVVLLDLTLPDSRGLDTFRQVRTHAPDVPVVILTVVEDDVLAMQAVREGAQDYLVKGNVRGHSLVRVLRYTFERDRARNGRTGQGFRTIPGRVVGFIGAKGGVGTTTAALNVAAAIVKQGNRALVAELSPCWSTLSFLVNHTPTGTLASLRTLPPERITAETLSPLLYKDPDGLQILFGPQRVEEFQELEPAQAEAILKGLATTADYVIADLPAYPSRANAAIIPHCDHVVLVIGRDPVSIESGRRTLELLAGWGAPPGSVIAALVNRTPLTSPVDTTEIGAQLSCDVLVVIPNALEACLRAQKQGVALVTADPGLPASARLTQLAEWLMAQRPLPAKAP